MCFFEKCFGLNNSFVYYNKYIQYGSSKYRYLYIYIYNYIHISNKQAQGSLKFLDIAIHCHMLDLAEVSHQFKALCLSSGGCCLLGVSWQKLRGLAHQSGWLQTTHTHNAVDGLEIWLTG